MNLCNLHEQLGWNLPGLYLIVSCGLFVFRFLFPGFNSIPSLPPLSQQMVSGTTRAPSNCNSLWFFAVGFFFSQGSDIINLSYAFLKLIWQHCTEREKWGTRHTVRITLLQFRDKEIISDKGKGQEAWGREVWNE